MESLRKVALYLHVMDPLDRQWMLGRLPADRAPALKAMLRELKQMGIPKDQSLLDLDEVAGTRRSPAGDRLARATGAQMARVLRGEPRETVAAVLMSGQWSWREDLLKSYDPIERDRLAVGAEGVRNALPPAVRATLLALLETRLQQESEFGGAPEHVAARPPFWKRLWRRAGWRR